MLPIFPIFEGLLRTDLNFDAHITDPCVILTHTYFQSNRDSRRSFSASLTISIGSTVTIIIIIIINIRYGQIQF